MRNRASVFKANVKKNRLHMLFFIREGILRAGENIKTLFTDDCTERECGVKSLFMSRESCYTIWVDYLLSLGIQRT